MRPMRGSFAFSTRRTMRSFQSTRSKTSHCSTVAPRGSSVTRPPKSSVGILKKLLPPSAVNSHESFVRQFGASDMQSRRMGERGTVAGRRKDGSEFPAEVSISKTSSGDGLTYTAILRDVSQRVKADQLLREREQRLRLALSAGQMGVFQIDEASGIGQYDETALRLLGLPMTHALSAA